MEKEGKGWYKERRKRKKGKEEKREDEKREEKRYYGFLYAVVIINISSILSLFSSILIKLLLNICLS